MTRKSSRGLVAITKERWSFASLLGDPAEADSGAREILNWLEKKARRKVKNGFLRAIFSRPCRLMLSAPGSPRMVCERSSNKALTANIFVFWIDSRLKERW